MRSRRNEPKVFFPWERRRGLRALFVRARGGQAILVVGSVVGFWVLSHLERKASDIRATRAEITSTIQAISHAMPRPVRTPTVTPRA